MAALIYCATIIFRGFTMSANSTPKGGTRGSLPGLLRGRFSEATDEFVEAFTASVGFDQRLYAHDILGSRAHAKGLNKIGVLSDAELADIEAGLSTIRDEIEAGEFEWSGRARRRAHEHRERG